MAEIFECEILRSERSTT